MFSVTEAILWSSEETLERLELEVGKRGWVVQVTYDRSCFVQIVETVEGEDAPFVHWFGEQVDPKLAFLDALGWITTLEHRTARPAWRPRETEVRLPTMPSPQRPMRDPADLDPEQIAAVYKKA